ncbi:hypothetical protein ACE193_09880 [Bernardetia sp. OM2101]|uniref:hypothetical protein n=1 Tax=Bernardetia sp. OM2101 TaxID=3344876 RepID=UPI0035CFC294
MDKIEDVENPEVGQVYLVAHAVCQSFDGYIDDMPIIPFAHADKDLGEYAKRTHYHIDGRFLSYAYKSNSLIYKSQYPKIVYKPKKLRRKSAGLDNPEKHLIYREFVKKHLGKSCKDRICPHNGAKMLIIEDKWICPLHNLKACSKTQKIIGHK